MKSPESWTTRICLDASFVMQILTESVHGEQASALLEQWQLEGRWLIAPTLLPYEISNGLHQITRHGWLTPFEAQHALDLALALGIHLYGDPILHRHALELAEAFALPAAYDAHYLALAQRFDADFWTADRRLFLAVHESLPWVYLLQ